MVTLRSSGRVVPPLGAGRSPTDEFKREQRMTQFILRPLALLMYAHVCGCGSAASFASLQVCLPFFSFSVFVYARANIIMCLSFSSRVLRYKNLLCNTSVIQRITKKFQGIRIICLVKVCLLALKGLLLHPQSREMRHFRQCY